MHDAAAFLAKIIEQPGDDTVRLVYADWLQENGDEERAEFIRLQIALTRPTLGPDGTGDSAARYHQVRREDWLLMTHGRRWAPVWPAFLAPGIYAPTHDHADEGVNLYWRRGFVHQVACPARDWLGIADRLSATHPVERVALTDMRGWDARVAQFEAFDPDGAFRCSRWPGVRFEMPGHPAEVSRPV